MKTLFLSCLLSLTVCSLRAQLTIDAIMADPKISVGPLPSSPYWSEDSRTVYFYWNPELRTADSLYEISVGENKPYKVNPAERRALPGRGGAYNRAHTQKVYVQNGDLFLLDIPSMKSLALTNTLESENEPYFSTDESSVFFTKGNNLFSIDLSRGYLKQWTNFVTERSEKESAKKNTQEEWLKNQQLALFQTLKTKSDRAKEAEMNEKSQPATHPKEVFLDNKSIDDLKISPDGKFITFQLNISPKNNRRTNIPSYVTESGFTENIPGRTKVGSVQSSQELWVLNIAEDTIVQVNLAGLDGLSDEPAYLKEYTQADTLSRKKPATRKVYFQEIMWSDKGAHAVVVVRSLDNKDRWIAELDPATASLKTLDRQRDEAWIGGPINALGFLDDHTLFFQSEADGFAHLYTMDLSSGLKKQLTKGSFEVLNVQLSRDKTQFYLTTNELNPGEQHLYKMSVSGGQREQITQKSGAWQAFLSPDNQHFAYLYSSATQPWELFLQKNQPGAAPVQITFSQSEQFKSYPWRTPEFVKIKARDGAEVHARLYRAKGKKGSKPAVVFVHGAGYLQNAHRWWSTYFRENMFHNFLADRGYTVLDMDYRGSAGYGRDWRTGIYRYMGGKDLQDHVDGAAWLVQQEGVDPQRIGIYGGSYGGFITLMAMFKTPDVFTSGAALRPVTDWAAYNHGYTSNILNEPQLDSIAYQRSSPINFADGLKGNLLICHGMIDVNVHYQDVVRLTQRLIELRKENWEVASYPVEDHGFTEPTSWADEYKRIFKLFERTLRRP